MGILASRELHIFPLLSESDSLRLSVPTAQPANDSHEGFWYLEPTS